MRGKIPVAERRRFWRDEDRLGIVMSVGIDNNSAERALRPIGNGRKNLSFAGAEPGAETLALAMTDIETAKLNGLDPLACLADILDRNHGHKIHRLDEVLPWNWVPLASVTDSQAA